MTINPRDHEMYVPCGRGADGTDYGEVGPEMFHEYSAARRRSAQIYEARGYRADIAFSMGFHAVYTVGEPPCD